MEAIWKLPGAITASTGTITCVSMNTTRTDPSVLCLNEPTLPTGKVVLGAASPYSPLIKTYYRSAAPLKGAYLLNSVNPFDSSTQQAQVVFFSGASTDPAIAVGAQSGTLTYGTAGSATFTLTPTHFTGTPTYTAAWCTSTGTAATTPAGVTLGISGATLTAATTEAANAGTYYFKVTAKNTTASETADSAVVPLTIGKADATAAMQAAATTVSTAANTLTLPVLPDGGAYGTPTVGTNGSGLLTGTPTIAGGVLTFATETKNAGTTATITIPVTGCTNYNDYTLTVTVTAAAPTTATFDSRNGTAASQSAATPANPASQGQRHSRDRQ